MASMVMCSNCGTKIKMLKSNEEISLMTINEWGKLGDACYCKKCIDTWKDRNMEDFAQSGGICGKDLDLLRRQ